MEDVKPTISSQSNENGAIEDRLANVCRNVLGIDERMMRQAMLFFKESKHIMLANMSAIGSGSPEEGERFWSAFVVYCTTRLSRGSGKADKETVVPLCQILRVFKLNVVDFFKEMPQLSLKAGHILRGLYGSDWEKRLKLKELQANFVHLRLLSRYYRRAYQEFFLTETGSAQHSAISISTEYVSDYHRFGWLLFLALRVHVFSRFEDLVTCTNGLVSILAVLILHVPVRLRKFKIQDSKLLAKKSDMGINLLASLCNKYQTSEDELRSTMEEVNNLIMSILKKKPSPASECKRENFDFIITDGLMYFEDLLEENSLQSSLHSLEKDYEAAIHDRCELELDERMFIDENESILGTGSLSGGAINMCGRKQTSIAIASPTKTPLRLPTSPLSGSYVCNSMMSIDTPVSTAMTTAKWLRDVILPLPSKPTAELQYFLSSCDEDLTADVTRRANIILGAIFPCSPFERSTTNLIYSLWTEQRKMEAMKLYYRVLEAMCIAESRILKCKNLTSLLTNERFHRCMLACSAELVLATHKTAIMMFPAVLERTGITAFDLSKVIGSFVRHETLPRELKRHLNYLEERLLESMAWEKGSSMYNSLIVARPSLSAEIKYLGLLAEPMPSLNVMEAHYNISTGCFPPISTHKREVMPDQNGDPQAPKRHCSESRSVLTERNSFTSPVKECQLSPKGLRLKLPHLQSAFASPTRPNPTVEGETCAETGINIFFSKILKLAAIRIRSLCERLQLSQQSLERIYRLFHRILSRRTTLFFNRHIDQLILCCFYGVAKISQLSLTFREIIYRYRKQPQCNSQVFRSVFVSSTSRNGKVRQGYIDIITFYNEIFIPSVKPLLVHLASDGVTQEDKSFEDNNNNNADCHVPVPPRFPPFPNLPEMSPKKVSPSHNVYVSPLRSSDMDTLLSPTSKSYYACVGESTRAFQSPSKDLTDINNRLNNGRKVNSRLNFDLVSDSVVARSLDLRNGASTPSKVSVKSEQSDS